MCVVNSIQRWRQRVKHRRYAQGYGMPCGVWTVLCMSGMCQFARRLSGHWIHIYVWLLNGDRNLSLNTSQVCILIVKIVHTVPSACPPSLICLPNELESSFTFLSLSPLLSVLQSEGPPHTNHVPINAPSSLPPSKGINATLTSYCAS
jgi:hypothetical protein